MKTLVQTLLVTGARLFIFLAVFSWVIGQGWYLRISCPAGALQLCEQGWLWEQGMDKRLKFVAGTADSILPVSQCVNDWRFGEENRPDDHHGFLTSFYVESSGIESFPGVVVVDTPFMGHSSISVRHWLVLVVSGTVYCVLHFVYHRRPAESPRDSQPSSH